MENILISRKSNVPFRIRGCFINASGLVPEYVMSFKMFESRFEIMPVRMLAFYGTYVPSFYYLILQDYFKVNLVEMLL